LIRIKAKSDDASRKEAIAIRISLHAKVLAGIGTISPRAQGGAAFVVHGVIADCRAAKFFSWLYSLVLTCTDLYWPQAGGAELQFLAPARQRRFRVRVQRRNCRSGFQNVWRARRGGVLAPSILRIPRSGLSFRHSCGNYGTTRKGQKTYGSVFGMIFFGGVGPRLVVGRQWLATQKIAKNRKNAKKNAK
jgi:hypothetical protein